MVKRRAMVILGLFGLAVAGCDSRGTKTQAPPTLNISDPNVKGVRLDCGNGVSMDLVLIRSGSFNMGSREEFEVEMPPHLVTIGKSFYLGICEVTQLQWQAVLGNNPSHFKGENLPAEQVSLDDCQLFCKKLSAKSGKAVRLPTEEEWEYACRAGTSTRFSFGSEISNGKANYGGGDNSTDESREKTLPVGSFQPNAWGLYDMHGNVCEWCSSWYDKYPGSKAASEDFGKTHFVYRGGSWNSCPVDCRSANRRCGLSDYRSYDIGFRLAMDDPENTSGQEKP